MFRDSDGLAVSPINNGGHRQEEFKIVTDSYVVSSFSRLTHR